MKKLRHNMLAYLDVVIHVHPVCDTCDVPITARRCDSIFPAKERPKLSRVAISDLSSDPSHVDRWICVDGRIVERIEKRGGKVLVRTM